MSSLSVKLYSDKSDTIGSHSSICVGLYVYFILKYY